MLMMLGTLAACQSGGAGSAPAIPEPPAFVTEPVNASPNPVTLVTPTPASPAPVETAVSQAASAAPHPSWVEYRDQRYGYGIALPCWWPVIPTPMEGYGGVMTTSSYDQAFFQAYSTKGWWTGNVIPEGAIKLDVGVMEEIPAGQPAVEVLRQNMDPTLETIVGSQEIAFGPNQATVVEIDDPRNPDEPNTFVVIFRLGEDKLLRFVAFPSSAISGSDLQQILGSLALTPGQPVRLPSVPPSPPLIELPQGCQYP